MIKHAHHDFDIDTPGKDSYELRKAGADQMLVASAHRWALMVEHRDTAAPSLSELIQHLDRAALDLILVEGFKHESIPKIEVHRVALGKPWLYPQDAQIIALASDSLAASQRPLTMLNVNAVTQIAEFICNRCHVEPKPHGVMQ